MTQRQTGKAINWWKWAFLLLLAANISLVAVLASRVVTVREPDLQQVSQSQEELIQVGHFTTNRSQINATLASYLKPYQTKKLSYTLHVGTSSILFEGTYQLLGYEVPLYIYFEPYRLETGAVQLRVTSFSVGTLPLPEADVLRYIKSSYDLPDFVTVQPKESAIVINLQDIQNEAGISLKASKIDLVNDDIRFELYKKK